MCVDPDLDRARLTASTFRVLPSDRGWYVWALRPWTANPGGWCIVVETQTREDGWLHVLSRLGLMADAPPAPLGPRPHRAPVETEWP